MNETDTQASPEELSACESEAVAEVLEDLPDTPDEPNEPNEPDTADELPTLRAELENLRSELEHLRRENALQKRMAAEVTEFVDLYPNEPLSSVPDTVWDAVKNGIPLAASFALYEKKSEVARQRAEAVNLQNAKRSAGAAGRDAPAEYFSPDEVRTMSPSEVRRNYAVILDSMKSWNR